MTRSRTSKHRATPALAVAMLALLIALAGTAAAGQRGAAYEQGLAGSWRFTVTQLGPGAAPPFQALAAFSDGGSAVEANQRNQSAAIGTWEKIDEHEYTWTVTRSRFNSSGTLVGSATIVEHDTLNQAKDELDGTSTVEFRDPTGAVIGGGPAQTHATRIDAS